jgi:Zn-dependent peptidase ImmA (M78 family)/DNA-binding XRE family transcriptional regulator
MPITQQKLAERLRDARSRSGLTQQEVADALEIARTAVVQIEAGRRAVTSLELEKMARLYGRSLDEFFAEQLSEREAIAFFRAAPELAEDPVLQRELQKCSMLSRQAALLERLLGRDPLRKPLPRYDLPPPRSRWDAICQGRDLAAQERRRLDLGASPTWEIAEIIRQQGVKVTELSLPDSISGIFFHDQETGPVIVINQQHARSRRLFSYAHEYCHTLVDRSRQGTVSSASNRDELFEVRANAFAAHFLMPEEGVRSVLAELGKLDTDRSVQEIHDGAASITAQRRDANLGQGIEVHDVASVAHHFGVSYEAALYHLLNLKLLPEAEFEVLRDQGDRARSILRLMRVDWGEETHWSLTGQLVALGLEAYGRDEISRRKLLELAEEAGADVVELEKILERDFDDGEAVDVVPGGVP